MTATLRVGTRIRIERDEKRWPPRGSWSRFRGRIGTVVTGGRTGEFGVAFRTSSSGPEDVLTGTDRRPADAYFLPHELVVIG